LSLDLTVREAIIPASNDNRPGYAMVPAYITVHETSNYAAGADAEMHRRFVANGGGSEEVSFHWVVDDHEAIHLVPDDEVAWHAGDGAQGPGNRSSVAIETCVNQGSDWGRTRRNLAILTAQLMHQHGIPLAKVVQHNHWSGKNCPLIIRKDGLWAGQLAATKAAYEALGTVPAPTTASPYLRAWPALWG
jgi:N-acetylmuramoyl-L-alanine amidase